MRKLPTRDAYGRTLVELGKENPDIVVLDADLSGSTRTRYFAEAFKDRFFDCGVAEQNMISIAAGLAASGKVVFASTFAVFAPGRCFDQIRVSVAQPELGVKVVTTHGGITVGEDGVSHQAVEDLALACSYPGFRVIVPADGLEASQAVRVAAETEGPFYIRLSRLSVTQMPPVCLNDYNFELGKAATLREGKDATIIACGVMVHKAMTAADSLAEDGIQCRVLNMSTIKPLDKEAVLSAATETGAIIVAEEHLRHGGLGSAAAQVVVENHPVPMAFIGIDDTYAESGKPEELMKKYGLSACRVAAAVRHTLQRKNSSL